MMLIYPNPTGARGRDIRKEIHSIHVEGDAFLPSEYQAVLAEPGEGVDWQDGEPVTLFERRDKKIVYSPMPMTEDGRVNVAELPTPFFIQWRLRWGDEYWVVLEIHVNSLLYVEAEDVFDAMDCLDYLERPPDPRMQHLFE